MKRQLAMWRVKQFSVSERNASGGLPNSSKAKEKPGESRDAFSTKDLTLYHQKWMKSLAVILPFILICCIPVIVHAHEKSHAARERLLSFDGELSLSNPPRIGERATLTLEISSKISNPRPIEVVFRLPDGLTAHSQSTFANQLLPLNTAQSYSVEIQGRQVGVYTIQASTYWTENGSTKAQHFYTYLAVNQHGSQVSKASIPPTYSQRLEPLRGKRLNRTLVDTQKVLVQGQIRYFDDNQRLELPIRHVGVRLLEQNAIQPDEEIGKTETDADGRYHFPEIDNTDPEDETKRDLYVIITFENSILKLTSESNVPYQFQSEPRLNIDSGDVEIDLSFNSSHQLRPAGHIFNVIQDEHAFVQEHGGWQRSQTHVIWPVKGFDGAAFSPREDVIWISTEYQWERPAMLHEYGHALMYAAYDNDFPKTNRYGAHYIFTVSDKGFALIEGFAEFMEAVVDDNAFNLIERLNRQVPNAETNKWWRGGPFGRGNNTNGEIVEGAVASILWDIVDTASSIDHQPGSDDDKIANQFQPIWQILIEDKPQGVVDFWHGWLRRENESVIALREIYFNHGIVLPLPPQISTGRVLSIPTELSVSPNQKGVVIPINLDDFSEVAGGNLRLTYDANSLSVAKVGTSEATKNSALSTDFSTPGEIQIVFTNSVELTAESGAILVLTFDVLPEAVVGQSTALVFTQVTLHNKDWRKIEAATQNGQISIENLIGDLNRDGQVGPDDAILVLKIEKRLHTPTDYQRSVADVNGDGQIDSADATSILRESIGLFDGSRL